MKKIDGDKAFIIIFICIVVFGDIMFFAMLDNANEDNSTSSSIDSYSYEHRCEYSGCSNYASKTKYCSKHTTYNKCAMPGCSSSVSYSGAKYCIKHELELYGN